MKSINSRTENQTLEKGQGFVEYALILLLVGIAVVLIVSLMQPAVGDVFSRFVSQAPVAPPSLLNYTPPPTATNTPTVDPNATATSVPSNTPVPSDTPVPTDTVEPSVTPIPSDTPVPSNTPSPTPCGPYGPHTVPAGGSVRVQMEDFRCGGAGVAFSDQSEGGPGSGLYRSDVGSEGPDLENTSDSSGGVNVGWTRDNEWIEYQINAPATDSYTFIIRFAAPNGNNPQLLLRTTSVNLGLQDSTNTLSLGATGGWQSWQNYTARVTLYEGDNIVRFNIVNGPGNYNYFDIQPYVPTATPTPVTPTATPIPTNTPVPPTVPPPVVVTLYSNASHDGDIRENNGTGNGANNQVDNSRDRIIVGDNDDNWNEQWIGIVSFDTSAIPANATITSVQMRLQQQGINGDPFNDLGALYADIGTANGFGGSYTLAATDFQSPAANNNVILLDEPTGDGDWAEGAMNSSFYGLINRNGHTQFKIHFALEDDGDEVRDRFRFFSGDNSQADRPQLIITYTVP